MNKAVPIILIVLILLCGCTSEPAQKELGDATTEINLAEVSVDKIDREAPKNYEVSYTGEEHKVIEFDSMSFELPLYHISHHSRNEGIYNFELKVDKKGYDWLKDIHISIQETIIEDLKNDDEVIAYFSDMYNDYYRIKIFRGIEDKSGIINLYSVTMTDTTYYIVYYTNKAYLIKSNDNMLEEYFFSDRQKEDLWILNERVECANDNTTLVSKVVHKGQERIGYRIKQGIDGTQIIAVYEKDEREDYNYRLTVKDENENLILELYTPVLDEYNGLKISDVNMDGYADICFIENSGTMNGDYVLYTWNATGEKFEKVVCSEELSYFEVYDGYIKNWQKAGPNSGSVQKLIWKENALILETDEEYKCD